MKKASITEAKNNLSALTDGVKGGTPVLIMARGRPVARLEPVNGVASSDDGRLDRLVRWRRSTRARRHAQSSCRDEAAAWKEERVGCAGAARGAPRQPMKFWDASAVVPLLMSEATTKTLQAHAAGDPVMLVWWASEVECTSAIARLEREGALAASAANQAFDRLRRLAHACPL
jgi:prevent-host-death family protein